jgi:glycosyltransferase involved in cell wall biosynthesis
VRVAVDATPLVGHRTGVGRFVEALLPRLSARDDVETLPYVLSRGADDGEIPARAKRVIIPARAALWSWGHGGPSLRGAFPPADVVHGTNHLAPPGPRTVVTVHDCSFVTAPEDCTPTVAGFGPVVRRIVAKGGWIHTPSEHVATQARELFGTTRVVAVHHGPPESVGVGDASPGLVPDAPFVLALATLEPRKNLPRLVRAFGAVAARHTELLLLLAGPDGPDAPAIRATIGALPPSVRDRVRTVGYVGDGARAALLGAASVLAYPSLDEGFGLPMLEAWQHDVPVVAASAGALPEIAGDAAVIVDPLDVEALAAALDRAITDEAARRDVVGRGRRRLRTFSWDETVDGIVSIYRQTMEIR